MPFSEDVKLAAFRRSGGRCECARREHRHYGRCNALLTTLQGWDAHHITAESVGGGNTLANCEALCIPCHQATDSYGRS